MRRSRCIRSQVRNLQFQHLQKLYHHHFPHPNSYPSSQSTSTCQTTKLTPPDLKNTSDDAIPNYLNSLSFTQSHTLGDVRLALGYSAFAICAACFYWDYKLGFDSTKYYTAAAVTLYTLLNGALTLWVWLVEGGTVYVGTTKTGDKVFITPTHHSPTHPRTHLIHLTPSQ